MLPASKYTAVISKNGAIYHLPVPGCSSASEARAQASRMYEGKVLNVIFEGPERSNRKKENVNAGPQLFSGGSRSEYESGDSLDLVEIAILGGILLLIMAIMTAIANWPILLVIAAVYFLIKFFKK